MHTRLNRFPLIASATAFAAIGLFAVPVPARAACQQFGFNGNFDMKQTNGWTASFSGTGATVHANATATGASGAKMTGTAIASVFSSRFVKVEISWGGGSNAEYTGNVSDDGYVHDGATRPVGAFHADGTNQADWNSLAPLKCMDAAPPAAVQPPVEEKPVTPPVEDKPATPAAKTVKVSGDVEIYDVPGGDGKVIGTLRKDTQVEVLERKPDNWDHVASASMPGGSGWVWGDFIPAG